MFVHKWPQQFSVQEGSPDKCLLQNRLSKASTWSKAWCNNNIRKVPWVQTSQHTVTRLHVNKLHQPKRTECDCVIYTYCWYTQQLPPGSELKTGFNSLGTAGKPHVPPLFRDLTPSSCFSQNIWLLLELQGRCRCSGSFQAERELPMFPGSYLHPHPRILCVLSAKRIKER